MGTENRVHLKVDQFSRIEIKDVITMLKGLRSDAIIKIVRSSEVSGKSQETGINKEISYGRKQNIPTQNSYKKSPAVKGNTNLPQIRELNEIAALLRSMDLHQRQLSS